MRVGCLLPEPIVGKSQGAFSMAISHELSSEIATALLAAKDRSPRELADLKEVLLLIHSTLQRLTDEARRRKSRSAKQAAAGR